MFIGLSSHDLYVLEKLQQSKDVLNDRKFETIEKRWSKLQEMKTENRSRIKRFFYWLFCC